jgi:mono/diheme cytochrome c family protein
MRHLAKTNEKGNGMNNARTAMLLGLSLMMTSATFASPGASPDQDQIDRGHKVYDKWCFPCHGTGVGKPGTDSLAARGQKPAVLEERTDLTAPMIKQFVRHGVLFMPMFRKTEISDAELDAICAYLTRNNKP